MANTSELVNNWNYVSDTKNYQIKELWRVLKPAEDGKYYGDCEDFALTWAFLELDSSHKRLYLALLTGKVKMWYVKAGPTEARGGHAVLEMDGQFVDNWSKKLVDKGYMETKFKHEFKYTFSRFAIFYKLLHGLIFSNK